MSILQRLSSVKLFLPVSTQLIAWYAFVIFFVIVDLILTVIVNCFDHGPSKDVLFYFINFTMPIVLILDIIISFNVGFIKNGKIILNRKAANKEYMSTVYFYCDILALINSIMQIAFQQTIWKQINLFHYLIFVKLTTAYFLDSLIKKYVIKSFNKLLLYEVLKNFVILAIISHIIGSFYFYIDVLMYQNGWYDTDNLWIFSSYAFNNIYTSDFWVQYTYSYYVACVTLSGTAYGDIIPLNPHENLYIFCCFIFPMLIYSYVYASIFQALFNRRSTTAQVRRYKFLAKEYLKSLGVTERVMNKILTFLEFTHKKNMIVETDFIEGLAPTIKNQYLTRILEGKFEYTCFDQILKISQVDTSYLNTHLMNIIKQEYFPERFAMLDSDKHKIYYINSGKVVEVVKLSDTKKLSKPVQRFTHVGKTAFFTNQIHSSTYTYESNSFVMAHSIDYRQFKDVIKKKMSTLNEAYCYLQWKVLDQEEYDMMGEKCFFCDESNHILKDCNHLKFDRSVFKYNRKQQSQGRTRFNRDQIHKNALNRLNMQKKEKMLKNKPINGYGIGLGETKLSQKIYEPNKESMINVVTEYAKEKFLDKKYRNSTQQTEEEYFFQVKVQSLRNNKMEFEKVCIWDKFYPERNMTA